MDKEDVVYIYNGTFLSHKKNEIIQLTETWIDLEIIILSQRKTYHIKDLGISGTYYCI